MTSIIFLLSGKRIYDTRFTPRFTRNECKTQRRPSLAMQIYLKGVPFLFLIPAFTRNYIVISGVIRKSS